MVGRKTPFKKILKFFVALGLVFLMGCAIPSKDDIQPFADVFRSAVSAYAGVPLMDDQQQKEFNRKWEESKANQIASMPTGTKILEHNRKLTQV